MHLVPLLLLSPGKHVIKISPAGASWRPGFFPFILCDHLPGFRFNWYIFHSSRVRRLLYIFPLLNSSRSSWLEGLVSQHRHKKTSIYTGQDVPSLRWVCVIIIIHDFWGNAGYPVKWITGRVLICLSDYILFKDQRKSPMRCSAWFDYRAPHARERQAVRM